MKKKLALDFSKKLNRYIDQSFSSTKSIKNKYIINISFEYIKIIYIYMYISRCVEIICVLSNKKS